MQRLYTHGEVLASIRTGSIIILNDGQWEATVPKLKQSLIPGQELVVERWARRKRSFTIPTAENLKNLAKSQREYRIVYIK